MKKTKKMLQAEKKFGRPVEVLLAELLTDGTLTDAAKAMGCTKSLIEYWMLKLGVMKVRVVLAPGDKLTIARTSGEISSMTARPIPSIRTEDMT